MTDSKINNLLNNNEEEKNINDQSLDVNEQPLNTNLSSTFTNVFEDTNYTPNLNFNDYVNNTLFDFERTSQTGFRIFNLLLTKRVQPSVLAGRWEELMKVLQQAPRRRQEAAKMPQKASKRPQEPSKTPQEAPRAIQDAPKKHLRSTKCTPKGFPDEAVQ